MQRRAGLPDGRVTNRSPQPRSTRSIRPSRRCRRTPLRLECAARQPARVQGRWHRFALPTRGHPAPLTENDSGAARGLWEALVRRIGRALRSCGPARILRQTRPPAVGSRRHRYCKSPSGDRYPRVHRDPRRSARSSSFLQAHLPTSEAATGSRPRARSFWHRRAVSKRATAESKCHRSLVWIVTLQPRAWSPVPRCEVCRG